MNTQRQQRESVLDTHQQYNSGFLEQKKVDTTEISDDASKKMRATDPYRRKYLSKLVTYGLKLGGRSTKKINKNKYMKISLRRRHSRYSKKNRK